MNTPLKQFCMPSVVRMNSNEWLIPHVLRLYTFLVYYYAFGTWMHHKAGIIIIAIQLIKNLSKEIR